MIGRLFSIGTSDFMKKQFGEGYHLVITPQYIINFVLIRNNSNLDREMKLDNSLA